MFELIPANAHDPLDGRPSAQTETREAVGLLDFWVARTRVSVTHGRGSAAILRQTVPSLRLLKQLLSRLPRFHPAAGVFCWLFVLVLR